MRVVEVQAAESAGVVCGQACRAQEIRRLSVGSGGESGGGDGGAAPAVAVRSVEVVMEVKGAAVTVAVKEEAAVVEEILVTAAGCREPAVRG